MPDVTNNYAPTSFRVSTTSGTNFNNRENIIPDSSTYAESEQNATFTRYMYLYPTYSLNSVLPANAVIRQVRGYLEALKVSTSYAMNFYYCIKKTVNGTGEDIIGWSASTSVPTSWGAKTFVYNETSADYKPKRSDFNESFYIGYRWDGSGLLSSSLIRARYHYITVSYYIPVTSITLSDKNLALEYGDTRQLTYSYLPLNTTDNFSWSSSNTAVATVSGAGLVTAAGSGTATITLKSESGVTATCAVTVTRTFSLQTGITPSGAGSVSPSSGYYNFEFPHFFTPKRRQRRGTRIIAYLWVLYAANQQCPACILRKQRRCRRQGRKT